MKHFEEVKKILCDELSIHDRMNSLTENSSLLENIPELDSMAVVKIITALEKHFDLTINDDEINADVFKTLGSLNRFIDQKLQNQ